MAFDKQEFELSAPESCPPSDHDLSSLGHRSCKSTSLSLDLPVHGNPDVSAPLIFV